MYVGGHVNQINTHTHISIYICISKGYASAAGPLVFRACKLGGLKVQRLGGLDVQRTKILQAKKRKGSLLVLLFPVMKC